MKRKILLLDLDNKYPNLALMKLSAYHKAREDQVFLNFGIGNYDKVYASCVFPQKACKLNSYPYEIEAGGTGIDINKKLPDEIEFLCPDYSLYKIDYGLGFITRGCIRNCPFCIVPQKEGKIKFWQEPEKFKNPLSNRMVFYDGNFLAYPGHKDFLQKFVDKKWKVDFNQGLDIRLIDKENARLLRQCKWLREIAFAWDFMEIEKKVRKGIELLKKAGFKNIMFYMLTGFNTTLEEDMYRHKTLKGLGITPYVMLYEKDKQPRIIREFQRWGNIPQIWRHISFEKFLKIRKVKKEEEICQNHKRCTGGKKYRLIKRSGTSAS